jgi:hypothetical protein
MTYCEPVHEVVEVVESFEDFREPNAPPIAPPTTPTTTRAAILNTIRNAFLDIPQYCLADGGGE